MQPTAEQVNAGQAVYSRRTLSLYDLVVLGISNRYFWRCPTEKIANLYSRHLSVNHLDVGVGSGYFLDRCPFPSARPRVVLMDLNPNSLAFTANRIERYQPQTCLQNILEPIADDLGAFDSVAVNYLLHCLPGSMVEKAVVFEHLLPLMNPGAVLFGATILQGDTSQSWLAKRLMTFYNRKGIFSNRCDDLAALEKALVRHFVQVDIQVVGCVALFSGYAGS
ncbi:MAG: class I SAM-dependent methyltransferase [Gammaproteobacteria bacterium]|nr:MAG: class I SAM-dependent methyltransferase [Gammaproteobacteria bacterium]